MVVVEVRQGTLGVDGRGWGPAENTVDRGSQLSKDDEDDEDDEEEEERRTRQEEAEEEEEKEEKEEEEATDIKSNNPHLAGGEKHILPKKEGCNHPSGRICWWNPDSQQGALGALLTWWLTPVDYNPSIPVIIHVYWDNPGILRL